MAYGAPRKSLGQHFLTDRNILGAIADAAEVGSGDTVIEVGPGRGALTAVLAERAQRVIAVELDGVLARSLVSTMPSNVEVVERTPARPTLPRCSAVARRTRCSATSRTTPRCPSSDGSWKQSAVLSARRCWCNERSQSRCARSRERCRWCRWRCSCSGAHASRASCVRGRSRHRRRWTSAVVGIALHDGLAEGVDDAERFFVLARAGFSAPRKQLRNALSGGLNVAPDEAERLLADAGIEAPRRAQTLSMAEWASLYRTWRGAA